MRKSDRWSRWLMASCAALALLMVGPQMVHILHPDYQGIPIPLNADEDVSSARMQEVLSGRGERTHEPFIGDPALDGVQGDLLTRLEGAVFRLFGVGTAGAMMLVDILIPVLILLLLVVCIRAAGFTNWQALSGAVAFCLLSLYQLNDPISMRTSFLLILATMLAVQFALERRLYWAAAAGLLLGSLVGVYFWSWSFAWIFWGTYFLWEVCEWAVFRYADWSRKRKSLLLAMLSGIRKRLSKRKKKVFSHAEILSLTGMVGIIAALPALFSILDVLQHPLYELATFRMGMRSSYLPESWGFSLSFLTMAVCSIIALSQDYDVLRPFRPAFVVIFAAFLYLHQQFLHGTVFHFVSHGFFILLLASIFSVLLAVAFRSPWLKVSAGAALLVLLSIVFDSRLLWQQWAVSADEFSQQHLSDALPVLNELPRTVILSDPHTSALVAGYSHHDIAYSLSLFRILMSNEEIAERFCLTQIPVSSAERSSANHPLLRDPTVTDNFFGEELLQEACADVDSRPAYALDWYGVEYVLWDEVNEPGWDLTRFRAALDEEASGKGWSLWKVL